MLVNKRSRSRWGGVSGAVSVCLLLPPSIPRVFKANNIVEGGG